MLGKRPHQIQRTTSMSQLRAPPSARLRAPPASLMRDHIMPSKMRTPADAVLHPQLGDHQEFSRPSVLEGESTHTANPHPDVLMAHVHLPGHSKASSTSLPLKVASPWAPPPLLSKPPISESFLDACYSCKKPLGHGKDIFMYRGDAAFCSEDCRLRQISYDERRSQKLSVSAPRGANNVDTSTNITSPSDGPSCKSRLQQRMELPWMHDKLAELLP